MAIPKKGSRTITVNGVNHRWLIRKKATYNQVDYGNGYLHVAIDVEENPSTTLVIYTNIEHPNDWATKTIVPITPRMVSNWISMAIELGWKPNEKGPQFLVSINEGNKMVKK